MRPGACGSQQTSRGEAEASAWAAFCYTPSCTHGGCISSHRAQVATVAPVQADSKRIPMLWGVRPEEASPWGHDAGLLGKFYWCFWGIKGGYQVTVAVSAVMCIWKWHALFLCGDDIASQWCRSGSGQGFPSWPFWGCVCETAQEITWFYTEVLTLAHSWMVDLLVQDTLSWHFLILMGRLRKERIGSFVMYSPILEI